MIEYTPYQVEMNLKRYDPSQFDVSFSVSEGDSEDERTEYEYMYNSVSKSEIDRTLFKELDKIDILLQNINRKLIYKDLILRDEGGSPRKIRPTKEFVLPSSCRSVLKPGSYASRGHRSRSRSKRSEGGSLPQLSPQRPSSNRARTSLTNNLTNNNNVANTNTYLSTRKSETTRRSDKSKLLIPFLTVAKIKKMVKRYREMKKNRDKEPSSPLKEILGPEEVAGFLRVSNDVLGDLDKVNGSSEFIKLGKQMSDKVREKFINFSRRLDIDPIAEPTGLAGDLKKDIYDFGGHMMKIGITKESDVDLKRRRMSRDNPQKNFEFLNNYIDKIKLQASIDPDMDKVDYDGLNELVKSKRESEDGDPDSRVKAFLKNFALQMRTLGLDHGEDMAQDAEKMYEKLVKKPENHSKKDLKGCVKSLDHSIKKLFLSPESALAGEEFINNVCDFADFLRALNELGKVKLSEADDMELDAPLRENLQHIKKELNPAVLVGMEDPRLAEMASDVVSQDDYLKLMLKLAEFALPPRGEAEELTEANDGLEVEFLSYEEVDPRPAESVPVSPLLPVPKANPNDFKSEYKSMLDSIMSKDAQSRDKLKQKMDLLDKLIKEAKDLHREVKLRRKLPDLDLGVVELLRQGAQLGEAYADCEDYMPGYTNQYKKANRPPGQLTEDYVSNTVYRSGEDPSSTFRVPNSKESPVLRSKDILDLYPKYYRDMNTLRTACAALMHALLGSQSLEADGLHPLLQPRVAEVKDCLVDLREALNTGYRENIVEDLGSTLPERESDLHDNATHLLEAIARLGEALNSELLNEDPELAERLKESNKSLLDAAIDLDEAIKAAKNIPGSARRRRGTADYPNYSSMRGERGQIQKEYDDSKDKFEDETNGNGAKEFLEENPLLKSAADKILELTGDVFQIHENVPARDALEKAVEDFIELAQNKLMDVDDEISRIPKQPDPEQGGQAIDSQRLTPDEKKKLLKDIIIKNLINCSGYGDKLADSDPRVGTKINRLIDQVQQSEILPLQTAKNLKEFCRKMGPTCHEALAEEQLTRTESQLLDGHVDEVSNAVDELMRLKGQELIKAIAERARMLDQAGARIDVDFKRSAEAFREQAMDRNYKERELGNVDRNLKLLTATIFEAAKHIQEAMNQKAMDLTNKVEEGDEQQNLEKSCPDILRRIGEDSEEIKDKIRSQLSPIDLKFKNAVERIRDIEKGNVEFQEKEELLDSALKDGIDDDVFKLGDSKLDYFDLKDAVSQPVQNLLDNAEALLNGWPNRGNYAKKHDLSSQISDENFSFDGVDEGLKKSTVDELLKDTGLRRNPDESLDAIQGRFPSSVGQSVANRGLRGSLDRDDDESPDVHIINPEPKSMKKKPMSEYKEKEWRYGRPKIPKTSAKRPTWRTPKRSSLDSSFGTPMLDNTKSTHNNRMRDFKSNGGDPPGQILDGSLVSVDESFYIPERETQFGEEVDVVSRRILHKQVPKKEYEDELRQKEKEGREKTHKFIPGESREEDWDSFYILVDNKKSRLPPDHVGPAYKRELRYLDPTERQQKRAKRPILASIGNNDDVIISSKLVPTGEWSNGRPVYKRVETRKLVNNKPPEVVKMQDPFTYFINCEGGEVYFAGTSGAFQAFETILDDTSTFVLLSDIEKDGLALVMLGDGSQANPVLRALRNESFKSIPLFVKQQGSILGREVYLHHQFDKLKAYDSNSGISRHTVWKLDKDPSFEPLDRRQAIKFLETMNEGHPLHFYSEDGEEIDGDRVLVEHGLSKLLNIFPALRPAKEELFSELDKKKKPREGEEVIYDEVGRTEEGSVVYEQKIVRKIKKPKLNASSQQQSRIMRESAINYLNHSQTEGESQVIKPVLQGLSRMEDRQGNPNLTLDGNEDILKMAEEGDFGQFNSRKYSGGPDQQSRAGLRGLARGSVDSNISPMTLKERSPKFNTDYKLDNHRSQQSHGKSREEVSGAKENAAPMSVVTESGVEAEDSVKMAKEKEERFVRNLGLLKNPNKMIGLLNAELERFDDRFGYLDEIDRRFLNVVDEARRRNYVYDDDIFPPASCSLVNNTRKTTKEYAGYPWKSLNQIYQVTLQDLTFFSFQSFGSFLM